MEYYSAKNRNELLAHTTTWLSLKNILSEREDTKTIFCLIPFIRSSRPGKLKYAGKNHNSCHREVGIDWEEAEGKVPGDGNVLNLD